MNVERTLFARGEEDPADHDEIWDDAALIEAYDRALSLAREELGMAGAGDSRGTDKSGNRWQVGAYCSAVYTEDGEFYEAEIINIDGKHALLEFVGYGNRQRTPLSALKSSSGKKARKQQKEQADLDAEYEETGAFHANGDVDDEGDGDSDGAVVREKRRIEDRSARDTSLNGEVKSPSKPGRSTQSTEAPPDESTAAPPGSGDWCAAPPPPPWMHGPPASMPSWMRSYPSHESNANIPPHWSHWGPPPPQIPSQHSHTPFSSGCIPPFPWDLPPRSNSTPMIPPPPPPPPAGSPDHEEMAQMLMSWYLSGYFTGYYQAKREANRHR